MRYLLSAIAAALVSCGVFALGADAAGQYRSQYGTINDDARLVASMYEHYLGREPDATGLQGWMQELRRGRNVEAAILGSDEYLQRHGSSMEGFIAGLYVDVLSRQPAWNEVQGWVQRLQQQGFNREAMAADFLNAAAAELATRGVQPPAPIYQQQLPAAPGSFVIPAPQYYRPSLPMRAWVGLRF